MIGLKPFRIRFDEIDGIITTNGRSRYLTLFDTKNITLFTTKLDVL